MDKVKMGLGIIYDFWTDKDLRKDDTILELLQRIIAFGEPFVPEKYLLEKVTRNRWMKFRIPESYEKVKEAIYIYDIVAMTFLSETRYEFEFTVTRRGYDGVNIYGRPADPNVIGLEVEKRYFEGSGGEDFIERFLEVGKTIYNLTHPFFGEGHDLADSTEITPSKVYLKWNRKQEVRVVYWANFWGPELVKNLGGVKRLREVPCWRFEELGDGGVLVVTSPSPLHPDSPENRRNQRKVLEFLYPTA